MGLTAKRQRFVEEYPVDWNATKAAIRAGFSEKTAYSIGHELLKKPEVREAIFAHQLALAEQAGITPKLILDRLKAEMLYFGEGSSHAARIRAAELLGKTMPDVFPPEELRVGGSSKAPPIQNEHTITNRIEGFAPAFARAADREEGTDSPVHGLGEPVDSRLHQSGLNGQAS